MGYNGGIVEDNINNEQNPGGHGDDDDDDDDDNDDNLDLGDDKLSVPQRALIGSMVVLASLVAGGLAYLYNTRGVAA